MEAEDKVAADAGAATGAGNGEEVGLITPPGATGEKPPSSRATRKGEGIREGASISRERTMTDSWTNGMRNRTNWGNTVSSYRPLKEEAGTEGGDPKTRLGGQRRHGKKFLEGPPGES